LSTVTDPAVTTAPSTHRGRVLMIEQGGRGGNADYVTGLVRSLAGDGWEVTLATASDHLFPSLPGVVVAPVFHYVRGHSLLARGARRLGLGQVANGLRFLIAIGHLVRLAAHSDIVHSQGWEFEPIGLVAVGAMRLTGTPVVQTRHNTFDRGKAHDRSHRMMAGWVARTIVHTEADLDRVPSTTKGRITVIPHGEYGSLARTGGDADRGAARAQLGLDRDTPVALMFGQLRPDKGLDHLLAAIERVSTVHGLIAGQELGALAACAGQLSRPEVAQRVTIREGFVDMSQAATLFAAADMAVLPYQDASQSGVLLLSYGFSRPVVIYPVGGLPEAVIDGETGWICARSDVDSLVAALSDAAAGGWPECRRRGLAGHALADERYSWPACAARTGETYRAVLARQATHRPWRMRAGSTPDL
jgi:glycosyltransferase involved in cell wall biosynthesis